MDPVRAIPVDVSDRLAHIRVVATDLDGTLLMPDGRVGVRTREALRQMPDADLELIIVTGRPPRWIAPIVDMTDHRGTAIAANGAVVLDLATELVVETQHLDAESAMRALEAIREAGIDAVFAVERTRVGRGIARSSFNGSARDVSDDGFRSEFALGVGYRPSWPIAEGTQIAPIEELLLGGDVVKFIARPVDPDDHTFLARSIAATTGIVEATHSGDRIIEMSALGVNKASTLARLITERSLAAKNVVTAGDAVNDIPMIEWAGLGCAVHNAAPVVIDVADVTIPSNADEGVAYVIESIVAQSRDL